jgi:hypothetical protein
MNSLTITATEGLDEQSLLDFLSEQRDEIAGFVLDFVTLPDPRATVDDESLSIESVSHVNGQKYIAQYSFDWSAYHGCKDKDKFDTEPCEFFFIYTGDKIFIEVPKLEERSTYDEL